MGQAAVGEGLGGASLLAGILQNQGAQSAANKAANAQQQLINRQTAIADAITKAVTDAHNNGFYDPSKRIALMDKDTGIYQSRDLGNLAGALTTAGFKPGDSTISNQLGKEDLAYRRQREDQVSNLTQSTFEQYLNDLGRANPGAYSQGIATAGQNRQFAESQIQPLGGLLQSILPYLNQPKTSNPAGFDNGFLGQYLNAPQGGGFGDNYGGGSSFGTGGFSSGFGGGSNPYKGWGG